MEELVKQNDENLVNDDKFEFEILNVEEMNCVRGGDQGQTDYPTTWPKK